MDYTTTIWAVVVHVEKHLQEKNDYTGLERATGFALSHIRKVFSAAAGCSLSQYILARRVESAAFDIVRTSDSILEISQKYCFENPDTFTRAFRRVTGVSPSRFRAQKPQVGSVRLCAGVFGVGILRNGPGPESTWEAPGRVIRNIAAEPAGDSTVLYGVPRAGYGVHGATVLPICLKCSMDYLGQPADYSYLMVCTGAAFRLTWDTTCWNGGNVDATLAFDTPSGLFHQSLQGLGRTGAYLLREAETRKEDFFALIRREIDAGRPCIVTGIVGPPEANVITGYLQGGESLLGWNFFQDNPECAGAVQIDESGYFISGSWWDNPCTNVVLTLGEPTDAQAGLREILDLAVRVLTGRRCGPYAKGVAAYAAWKRAVLDDSQFPTGATLTMLAERMACLGDAMDCLRDGRGKAAEYFEQAAKSCPGHARPLRSIAARLRSVSALADAMGEAAGGWSWDEAALRGLAKPGVRAKIAELIDKAAREDGQALEEMKKLREELG